MRESNPHDLDKITQRVIEKSWVEMRCFKRNTDVANTGREGPVQRFHEGAGRNA